MSVSVSEPNSTVMTAPKIVTVDDKGVPANIVTEFITDIMALNIPYLNVTIDHSNNTMVFNHSRGGVIELLNDDVSDVIGSIGIDNTMDNVRDGVNTNTDVAFIATGIPLKLMLFDHN